MSRDPALTRRRLLLLAPAGLLAAGLAGTAGWLLTRPAEQGIPIGGPFELVDGNGRTVTDQAFRGKWMLVYFGYTHCPDACPLALQNMAAARDLLGPAAARVSLVFITLDPERDTPEVMRDYAALFGPDVSALTGSADAVSRVAKEYRVYSAKAPTEGGGYSMDHTSIIYAMDPRGRFAGNFTHETTPEAIAARLRSLV